MRRRYEFDAADSNDDVNLDTLKKNKSGIHGAPLYVGLLFLPFLLGLFALANWIDNRLPTALTLADEKSHPDAFIAERAQHDLKLLSDLGPKVVGGHTNEVLAVDFLQREINFIMQQKHKNQAVEMDLQTVTGYYYLASGDYGRINKYANVQNVVVKLHGQTGANHSVLVNSHFDSVPTSPGASDDGISVVTMLEILRKLSRSPDRFKHNIIFLFNGAEETPLQASHGFITQHKWAKECRVVVNLEACGTGGKIILFQTGPNTAWLMNYYNKVPHPYGQAAGEEIFQSGLIPSDTDFRIFRDFGDLIGFDMAFYKNGYRYHTKYDNFDVIPPGSYQHIGDNALALIKGLADAPELAQPRKEKSNAVYFDIFGLFMISYSTTVALIINLLIVFSSVVVFVVALIDFKVGLSKTTMKYLLKFTGAILLGWILSFLFVLLVGFILDRLNYSMSWYSSNWIIFGIYVVPVVGLMAGPMFYVNHQNLSSNITAQLQAHLVRLIWTFILFVITILGVRAAYAILLPVLFNTLSFTAIHLFRIQHSFRKWQIVYIAGLIIPTLILMYQSSITLSLFIPITGRFGSNKNPELTIGILATALTIMTIGPYVALSTLIRDAKYFFIALGAIFVCSLIVVFSALGVPYNGDVTSATPQRYWISHTARSFYDETGKLNHTDSGIFFLNMDRNSPNSIRPFIKDLERAKSIEEDCKKYVICGLPLSHLLMTKIMEWSTWLPANLPIIHEKVQFTSSKDIINSTSIKYTITVTGPDRMGVYLVPKPNITVEDIQMDQSNGTFEADTQKKIYFIQQTYGKSPDVLKFTFDVKTPENWNSPAVDVAVTAIYVHERLFVKTPYYDSILKQFPDWADVTAWLASYSLYIL